MIKMMKKMRLVERWKDYAKVPRTEKLGKAGLVREKSFGTKAVTIITCGGYVICRHGGQWRALKGICRQWSTINNNPLFANRMKF
ncbi:hypothetical protein C5167_026595 [Papaver somniferum]|nr:hypothetical protein C5167_026595 [Papaver somniferum]